MQELDTRLTASPGIIPAHLSNVRTLLDRVPMFTAGTDCRRIPGGPRRGRFIYIAGNGGSAATASHWVNDLGKATKRSGRRPHASHVPVGQHVLVFRPGER